VDQTAGLLDSSTDEPRTVLRVIIENMLYSVSLDMLNQVVSCYSTVACVIKLHCRSNVTVSWLAAALVPSPSISSPAYKNELEIYV